ncbi:MAG: response regulator [Alphaproteobacteria bacterium]
MAVDRNLSILIVDDQATMRRIVRGLLGQLGFQNVDEADDGPVALTKMQAKAYGLVLCDWNMDAMSGLELLQEVRATKSFEKLPFILVTSENSAENVLAAKQAGVSNYIVKPFSVDTLKSKLSTVMGPL